MLLGYYIFVCMLLLSFSRNIKALTTRDPFSPLLFVGKLFWTQNYSPKRWSLQEESTYGYPSNNRNRASFISSPSSSSLSTMSNPRTYSSKSKTGLNLKREGLGEWPPFSEEENTNNLDKWQKMYDDNAPQLNANYGKSITRSKKSEIRVVTFDLDNTIWKTSNVISYANDALAKYLNDIGINAPIRVEKIMGQLFKENKAKYSPILVEEALNEYNKNQAIDIEENKMDANGLDNDMNTTSNSTGIEAILNKINTPVLLTQLRIDALKVVFNNQTNDELVILDNDKIETLAQDAFDVWTTARHDAIPHNLVPSAIECLNQVRALKTSYGKNIVVGAITDGNSDPRRVEMLKDFFDFCVNAESVGISKPDRRVYDAAILHVYTNKDLRHVFYKDGDGNSEVGMEIQMDGINCDDLFEKMKDQWIHIGDDFIKDIVGAKELKMRSVWSRELVKDKMQSSLKRESEQSAEKDVSESQFTKELAEKKVVTMIIGSEDFLLDSIQSEFADEIVDEFYGVSKILTQWHIEGLASLNEEGETDVIAKEVQDLFAIVIPDENDNIQTTASNNKEESSRMNTKMKFCVMCGTKLPQLAKFCSSCGNEQPVMP